MNEMIDSSIKYIIKYIDGNVFEEYKKHDICRRLVALMGEPFLKSVKQNRNNSRTRLLRSKLKFLFSNDVEAREYIRSLSDLKPLVIGEHTMFEFDIAISFAGEDRHIAESIKDELVKLGVRVFYDYLNPEKLWGEDLYVYLHDVYSKKSRFCVMLTSRHYAIKLWTNHERRAAQERAFRSNSVYILPIRLDDTEIPGMFTTTGYIDYADYTIEKICSLILERLRK